MHDKYILPSHTGLKRPESVSELLFHAVSVSELLFHAVSVFVSQTPSPSSCSKRFLAVEHSPLGPGALCSSVLWLWGTVFVGGPSSRGAPVQGQVLSCGLRCCAAVAKLVVLRRSPSSSCCGGRQTRRACSRIWLHGYAYVSPLTHLLPPPPAMWNPLLFPLQKICDRSSHR